MRVWGFLRRVVAWVEVRRVLGSLGVMASCAEWSWLGLLGVLLLRFMASFVWAEGLSYVMAYGVLSGVVVLGSLGLSRSLWFRAQRL